LVEPASDNALDRAIVQACGRPEEINPQAQQATNLLLPACAVSDFFSPPFLGANLTAQQRIHYFHSLLLTQSGFAKALLPF
jgi:hypothetical protein